MRIAVGGIQHETNTFAAHRASFAEFEAPDAWPGLTRGPALLEAVRGINLPAAGFIEQASAAGHTLLPLTWCSATPSGYVTSDAYERIVAMLIDDLRSLSRVDAIYLDLHGAMAAEHVDDADGELLRRIRAAVGPDMPVIASLDLHANVSPLMVEQASALVAYRTYPHTDMAQTGARAFRVLHDLHRRSPVQPYSRLRQLPFLIPLTSQCTLLEPLASLMDEAARRERTPLVAVNFTPGFPGADVAECGPAVFAYGFQAAHVDHAVEHLARTVAQCESEFALDIHDVAGALQELARIPPQRGRPVILADTQDNPGGGGTADTTCLLQSLIAQQFKRVLAGILHDPQAAARAHAAGVGAQIDLELGAHSRTSGQTPIHGRFTVLALGDGRFTATGPFYLGARMDLGPMALLRIDDVHIAVASRKQQAADQAMFRHLGAEPRDFAILALKSSVHFRADFGSMARRVLVVEAPGANLADPARRTFTKLRSGVRVRAGAGAARH